MDFILCVEICLTAASQVIATPLSRLKKDYWVWELGAASFYGWDDNIDGVCILSSIINHLYSINELLFWQKSLSMHYIHIKTIFTIPFKAALFVQLGFGKNKNYLCNFFYRK